MTFLHVSLLAGSALIAVPIILHLIMRRKPTLLEFPALRFLQIRQEANKRRLRLRHLLLLLLRAAAIAFLAFALARPSVQLGGTFGPQELPVAAALIFDAAPHMDYRRENQNRLQIAKEFGTWLLAQLPHESKIAVLDTRHVMPTFQIDRPAAQQSIERLEIVANSQSLGSRIAEAVSLLKQCDLPRKEIYVFSDLSSGSWSSEQAAELRERLKEIPETGIYVIDVGVLDPIDYGLGELRLSSDVLSNRELLTVTTELSSLGANEERAVELNLLNSNGNLLKRHLESLRPKPGESQHVEFRLGGLPIGSLQGFLRIVGQDALAADDTRYFSVEIKPPWRILIAAPRPAENYAIYLSQALAPTGFRLRGQARFDCHIVALEELATKNLADYAVVYLLDPTPLSPVVWRKLADFASEGGGVAIILGRNSQPVDSFNAPLAQELLAGKLIRQARRGEEGDLHLSPRDLQHPVLAPFRAWSGSVPWQMFQIYRYWQVDDLHRGVGVLLPFSDGRPAVLERTVGTGRAITMTTPISDRPNQNPWNMLTVGEDWPFMILMNTMTAYLTGCGKEQLNYYAGETVIIELDPNERRSSFVLMGPGNANYPLSADLDRHQLAITAAEGPGNYRVRSGGLETGFNRGFSVNLTAAQTQLKRISQDQLEGIFGDVKIHIARAKEQIAREIVKGRVGRELFPLLIFLVVVVLALESILANRFYSGAKR
ncbi:MAG: BatA domain-containing protein [Thermoguttaceae bacterium]